MPTEHAAPRQEPWRQTKEHDVRGSSLVWQAPPAAQRLPADRERERGRAGRGARLGLVADEAGGRARDALPAAQAGLHRGAARRADHAADREQQARLAAAAQQLGLEPRVLHRQHQRLLPVRPRPLSALPSGIGGSVGDSVHCGAPVPCVFFEYIRHHTTWLGVRAFWLRYERDCTSAPGALKALKGWAAPRRPAWDRTRRAPPAGAATQPRAPRPAPTPAPPPPWRCTPSMSCHSPAPAPLDDLESEGGDHTAQLNKQPLWWTWVKACM